MIHLPAEPMSEPRDEMRIGTHPRPRAAIALPIQLSMEGIHPPCDAPLADLERRARALLERVRKSVGGDPSLTRSRLETIRALAATHPDGGTHAVAGTAVGLLRLELGDWSAAIEVFGAVRAEGLTPPDEAFAIYVQCLAWLEIGPVSRVLLGCATALRHLGATRLPSLRARIRRLAFDCYMLLGERVRARRVLDRLRDMAPSVETDALVRMTECELLQALGRCEAAEVAARDTFTLMRRPENPGPPHQPSAPTTLRLWATILTDLRRTEDARRRALQGLEELDPVSPADRRETGRLHWILARLELDAGEETRAWESLRCAQLLLREARCHRDLADVRVFWGEIAALRLCEVGERGEAREGLFEARATYSRLGIESSMRRCDLALECLRATMKTTDAAVVRLPRPPQSRRLTGLGFLTCDPAVLLALEPLEALAGTTIPVLIQGESGTGKEVLSRALHRAAGGRGPFVAVNCGALPGELQESELFGHVRGAFTGAVADKLGLFEAADGGTLLLDEVGEMTPRAQVKLLRVLELGEVRRVGETRTRRVHVRVIAATNADLASQLVTGAFRRDLFFRLAGLKVSLPPLRSRLGDVPLLATHFAWLFGASEGIAPPIAPEALDRLLLHDWPGNVRELRFTMERAVALTRALARDRIEADCIDVQEMPARFGPPVPPAAEVDLRVLGGLDTYLMNTERRLILRALEENGWNRTRTARSLGGLSRTTLIGKMKRLGLFDGREEAPQEKAPPAGASV
jgi:DNA-binding NtrC family response regulator